VLAIILIGDLFIYLYEAAMQFFSHALSQSSYSFEVIIGCIKGQLTNDPVNLLVVGDPHNFKVLVVRFISRGCLFSEAA